MAKSPKQTERPFAEELPRLIEQEGWSVRALARNANISQAHLSRVISGERANLRPETIAAVTRALGLPADYFPEMREIRVVQAIKEDPALRERIYRQIAKT